MSLLPRITLLFALVLPAAGCRTVGTILEGYNSDHRHGGGYARVPEVDADGQMHVPNRDWSAGPERVW